MMITRDSALLGPSIQVDPGFPYYLNRSAESIVEEIELAGYRIVRYFVVNENIVNKELIQAFQAKGIAVWAMVLGNGTYSVDCFPEEWPEWQMELIKPTHEGFWKLSPFSEGYVSWKKAALARLVAEYGFDGIEIAEPYFPEWNGIETGVYGDIGPLARKAFLEQYGHEIPDFRDSSSPNFYLNIPDVYEKWIQFRVDAVNGFLDEMINGAGGVREAKPDILVATWSLAIDAGPESVRLLREYQGLDAKSMIAKVRPDIHVLQTHWPDWVKSEAELPGDYVEKYNPFVDDIRSVHPDLPLAVQADIGSSLPMLKGREWLDLFIATIQRLGYASWTAYEYHLGKYMYEESPVPKRVTRRGYNEIIISFNKRVDPLSAASIEHYSIANQEGAQWIAVQSVRTDGNRIMIHSDHFPKGSFELEINGIKDTPDLWLHKGFQENSIPEQCRIHVPSPEKENSFKKE